MDEDAASAAGQLFGSGPRGVLVIDGWIRPDAWRPGGGVMAQAESDEETAVARVVRSRRDGDRTYLRGVG